MDKLFLETRTGKKQLFPNKKKFKRGREAAPAHAHPLQQARVVSVLFANRFESVLLVSSWFPCVSPVVPTRPHDAGGPQPVVQALEPAGSGREAEAPAAGQILRGRGR